MPDSVPAIPVYKVACHVVLFASSFPSSRRMFGEMTEMTRSGSPCIARKRRYCMERYSREGEALVSIMLVNCQGLTPRYIMVAYQSRPMNRTMDQSPRT